MCLSKPQILYCMLGINYLEASGFIDPKVALAINSNLHLELGMILDSDHHEFYSDEKLDAILDENLLKRDPKSGWPVND